MGERTDPDGERRWRADTRLTASQSYAANRSWDGAAVFLFKNIEMLLAPSQHSVNYGKKRFAKFRYTIFGTGRQLGIDCLIYKTILHHLLQLYVKNAGRRLGQTFVYLARTHRRARTEFVENARLPFRLNQTHRQTQRTVKIHRYFLFVGHFLFYFVAKLSNMSEKWHTEKIFGI